MDTTQTAAVAPDAPHNYLHEAYVRWTPQYEAISQDQLLKSVNVDITGIVTMVRGSIKKILALREQCIAELPKEDATLFDVVESQVLGLAYAQGRHLSAQKPALPLPELSAEAAQGHDILSSGIRFAIKRSLLSANILRDLRGPVGYKNLASDLVVLVATYRDHEARLAGRTGVTKEDVDEAESLAYQLFGAIGEREHLPETVAATTEAKQRAFTLFMTTYDRIRRIVHYLRWDEGDADEIAPSCYAGRKRKDSDLVVEEPAAPAPNGAEPASTAPPSDAPASNVAAGHRGGSPYAAE